MSLPKGKKLPNRNGSGGRPLTAKGGKLTTAGGDKKKPSGGMPKRYGGLGGYAGVKTKTVRRLVNGVLRDEMKDLRGQARDVRRDARETRNQTNTAYNRGVGDLNYVHGETGDYLGSLSNQTQQMFSGQSAQQQQAQAALQGMLGGTYSGAQSGASDELARLGIQGGGNLGGISADQANAQNIAAISGANAQSTLGMAGANSQAGMQMLQGMNQGSMMQGMGQNLNRRNDALAEIQTNRINSMNEVRNAMQEAKGSRRDMFFQLLQQLQQTGWDQYLQQQQLQMQRKALKKH